MFNRLNISVKYLLGKGLHRFVILEFGKVLSEAIFRLVVCSSDILTYFLTPVEVLFLKCPQTHTGVL